jgi:hypothetical protein
MPSTDHVRSHETKAAQHERSLPWQLQHCKTKNVVPTQLCSCERESHHVSEMMATCHSQLAIAWGHSREALLQAPPPCAVLPQQEQLLVFTLPTCPQLARWTLLVNAAVGCGAETLTAPGLPLMTDPGNPGEACLQRAGIACHGLLHAASCVRFKHTP